MLLSPIDLIISVFTFNSSSPKHMGDWNDTGNQLQCIDSLHTNTFFGSCFALRPCLSLTTKKKSKRRPRKRAEESGAEESEGKTLPHEDFFTGIWLMTSLLGFLFGVHIFLKTSLMLTERFLFFFVREGFSSREGLGFGGLAFFLRCRRRRKGGRAVWLAKTCGRLRVSPALLSSSLPWVGISKRASECEREQRAGQTLGQVYIDQSSAAVPLPRSAFRAESWEGRAAWPPSQSRLAELRFW